MNLSLHYLQLMTLLEMLIHYPNSGVDFGMNIKHIVFSHFVRLCPIYHAHQLIDVFTSHYDDITISKIIKIHHHAKLC